MNTLGSYFITLLLLLILYNTAVGSGSKKPPSHCSYSPVWTECRIIWEDLGSTSPLLTWMRKISNILRGRIPGDITYIIFFYILIFKPFKDFLFNIKIKECWICNPLLPDFINKKTINWETPHDFLDWLVNWQPLLVRTALGVTWSQNSRHHTTKHSQH